VLKPSATDNASLPSSPGRYSLRRGEVISDGVFNFEAQSNWRTPTPIMVPVYHEPWWRLLWRRASTSAGSWTSALAAVSGTLAFTADAVRVALGGSPTRIVLGAAVSAAALAVVLSLVVGPALAGLIALCDRVSLIPLVGRLLAPVPILAVAAASAFELTAVHHRQDPEMRMAMVVAAALVIGLSLPAAREKAHRLTRVVVIGLTGGIFLIDATLPRWYYREIHDLLAMVTMAEIVIMVTPWRRTLRRKRLFRKLTAAVVLSLAVLFSVDWAVPGWRPRAREYGVYSGVLGRAARALVDIDGDGFSPIAWGGDCDDLSSRRNPMAVDAPGKGDLNCNGIDPPRHPTEAQRGLATAAGDPNLAPGSVDLVVLATIDALRWDSLRPQLMPHYSTLGSRGVTFDRAYSNGTRTAVSLPLAQKNHRLGVALATRLLAAGIKTTAVIADHQMMGTAAIASTYERVLVPRDGRWQGLEATDHALRAIDEAKGSPHFLWIHYYDAHSPYPSIAASPVPTPGPLHSSYANYATGVAAGDFAFGELVAGLSRRGLLGRTVIIATTDHGEAFGEHSMLFHSASTYETLVHIPMIIAAPGLAPQHYRHLVSLADVFATVLGAFGMAGPDDEFLGRSWLRLRQAPDQPLHKFVVIRSAFAASGSDVLSPMLAVVHGSYKLSKTFENGITELYDVATDPSENEDLWPSQPDIGRHLELALETYRDIIGYPADEEIFDMKNNFGVRRLNPMGEIY
jgi:hypothetical protein